MTSTATLSKKAILKAKVSSTAKPAAEVTSTSDYAIATPHWVYTTESTDVSDFEVKEKEPKKSKTNSIETKTIDALNNDATTFIFMNLFTIYCTQNGVDPTLKTIIDNSASSNELFQLIQPTHNESVKNNNKIEGETLRKLIHLNPVYLIHGTHEVQSEYLRSILDSNILALLKMVVPEWLQTDVAIKLNTQTDITECREAITERIPYDSSSNTGEKFPMNNNHAVPNHNSHRRNSHDAQAEQIRAETLPEFRKGSKVDLKKIRRSSIVYSESKGHYKHSYYYNRGRGDIIFVIGEKVMVKRKF
ncbi:hypothetical protein ACTFIR_003765 [Dictyostelium discoideum]